MSDWTEEELAVALDVQILKAINDHIGFIPDNETRAAMGLISMDNPTPNATRMIYHWEGVPILSGTFIAGKLYTQRLYNKKDKTHGSTTQNNEASA